MYEIPQRTKKEPTWVHIMKYKDAWIARLLGLTKKTKKKEGINKNSYNKKKKN